jgi:predicted transcriptional regulator
MSVEQFIRDKILEYIKSHPDTWIQEMARQLDISVGTVSNYVTDLEKEGLVESKLLGSTKVVRLSHGKNKRN